MFVHDYDLVSVKTGVSDACHIGDTPISTSIPVDTEVSHALLSAKRKIDMLSVMGVNNFNIEACHSSIPFYALLENYISNLKDALEDAVRDPQVAVLLPDPISAGSSQRLKHYCSALASEHIDYDVIRNDNFEKCAVADQMLHIQNLKYQLLLVPNSSDLPRNVIYKIEEFIEDGGAVVYEPAVPLRQSFSELIRPEVSIKWRGAECKNIGFIKYRKNSTNLYFFSNFSSEPREVQLSIRNEYAPYIFDLESGSKKALLYCTQQSGRTILFHRFEAYASSMQAFEGEPALILPPVPVEESDEIICGSGWKHTNSRDGIVEYSNELFIPHTIPGQRTLLCVDNPVDSFEILVNGNSAGLRAWPPYEVDISLFVLCGEINRISIKTTQPKDLSLELPFGGIRMVIA